MRNDPLTLIERLQLRDPGAVADLYDQYGRLTCPLIARIVRDGGIAEDLVQEIFLRVWTHPELYDPNRGAFRPWLLTVARNRAIDYLRASGDRWNCSYPKLEQTEDPKPSANLERSVEIGGRNKTLHGALGKLSVERRTVIDLAYFEGYSQVEMAAKLGQPLGTVKSWVRSALKILREELREPAAPETSRVLHTNPAGSQPAPFPSGGR